MSDYIKREDVLEKRQRIPNYGMLVDAVSVKDIERIPAADVEPVVRGEWKEFDADMNAYTCSVCNEPQMFIEGDPEQNEYSFCPHCGANMQEKSNE